MDTTNQEQPRTTAMGLVTDAKEMLKAAEIRAKRSTGDGQIAELERLKNRIEGLESRIHQRIIENQLREDPKPAASVRSSVDILENSERILNDDAK